MNDEEYDAISNADEVSHWHCAHCRLVKANNIKWGHHSGEENLHCLITSTYKTIIGWKKNIFHLLGGKCGSGFIKEFAQMLNLFVDKTKWEHLALLLVHIFIPIILQIHVPNQSTGTCKISYINVKKWNE